MIGIDTNLLVRLLVNDDLKQAEYAVKLFKNNVIFIPKTVLLETEWVLRFSYKLAPSVILTAFEKVLGFERVVVEDPSVLSQALKWYASGLDFADALHLASSQGINAFATLDKALIKQAKKLNIHLVTL